MKSEKIKILRERVLLYNHLNKSSIHLVFDSKHFVLKNPTFPYRQKKKNEHHFRSHQYLAFKTSEIAVISHIVSTHPITFQMKELFASQTCPIKPSVYLDKRRLIPRAAFPKSWHPSQSRNVWSARRFSAVALTSFSLPVEYLLRSFGWRIRAVDWTRRKWQCFKLQIQISRLCVIITQLYTHRERLDHSMDFWRKFWGELQRLPEAD